MSKHTQPDPRYENMLVSKLINQVMEDGKKQLAQKIVYACFDILEKKLKTDPVDSFEKVIETVAPLVEVRSRRVGGATYQVPVKINQERRHSLALRWIVQAASSRKGKPMFIKLADEMLQALEGTGSAIKKRENTHKMAEANKAFAHFAF
jgi:small subunit ribosomal protein S7